MKALAGAGRGGRRGGRWRRRCRRGGSARLSPGHPPRRGGRPQAPGPRVRAAAPLPATHVPRLDATRGGEEPPGRCVRGLLALLRWPGLAWPGRRARGRSAGTGCGERPRVGERGLPAGRRAVNGGRCRVRRQPPGAGAPGGSSAPAGRGRRGRAKPLCRQGEGRVAAEEAPRAVRACPVRVPARSRAAAAASARAGVRARAGKRIPQPGANLWNGRACGRRCWQRRGQRVRCLSWARVSKRVFIPRGFKPSV